MNKKIQSKSVDQLFDAILALENKEECYSFFEDICTIRELKNLSQRLEVAIMLRQNFTYHDIEEKLGASTATITRVSDAMNYGTDVYDLILKRINPQK